MVNNEIVITYKRKRLSSRPDLIHGIKALKSSPMSPTKISPRRLSPKVELNTSDKKVNKDYSKCFKCGNIDVDENLLRCGCCSETHHFHCMDAPQKRKWQCPICHRRNDSEGSQQYDNGESKRARKSKRTEETELGPIELRSHKVLLGIKVAGGPSRKLSCCTANSSLTKAEDSTQMDCTENSSCRSSKFMDLDDIKPDPIHLTLSTEIKYNSGCTKDSMAALHSDKINERPKEKCKIPLITFSRRVKRKREGTGKFVLWNSKSKEKQCPSTTLRGHTAESNCNYEDPSTICSFGEQTASAVVLLEQAEVANVEKDAGLKSTPVGGFGENKIAADGPEKLPFQSIQEGNISSQNPVPAQPATKVPYPADQSISPMEAAATDFIKHSISTKDDKQFCSAKIGSPVRKESRNELATMNSEETNLPHDVSLELERPCEQAFSIAPPASTCVSNVESSQPSVDVMAGNLLESQSSSIPSCPIALADAETDGRGKELEWLEDLDRVLQDKKNRNTCSFIEQGGVNCAQASDGRSAHIVLAKSSIESTCDQGASPQYMNQIMPLEGKVFFREFDDPGCEKQQHDEISTRSSLCSFLGMSLPVNHGSHFGPIKDVQSMLLPSSSGVKDNVHAPNKHLPWNPSNETSFLPRHKQMVENGITGTRMSKERMSKERRCSMASMFGKYSNDWSEEELDFLWIGVRRHGINNWNAMLRDPKLHFLESRVAEDLAMQWDIEQRKLLNGTLPHPLRFHRADYSPSSIMDNGLLARPTTANQYGSRSWSHASSEYSMFGAETKLSLGDVYHQNRNFFQPSGISIANPLKSESSSTHSFLGGLSVGSMFHQAGFRQCMPIKAQNARYDWGASTSQKPGEKIIHEQQSGGLLETKTSSNLPHWLKEVIDNKDPRPRGSSLPPVVSSTAHSMGLLNEDMRPDMPFPYKEPPAPPKDSRGRGILKRKGVGSNNMVVGLRINEMSSSLNEPWKTGVLPSLGKTSRIPTLDVTITPENNSISNQNINISDPLGPSDLVVIDSSDASSEETISDDQSSRPS